MSDDGVQMTITVEGITCNVNNHACLERQRNVLIERRKKALTDMSGPFAKVSVMLDRWVQMNFKTEGGNIGGWPPFKAGGRRRRGGGFDANAKLLQDTGRLRASFKPFAHMTNAGIGSDLPYAKPHDEGIGVPERRMLPKREEVIDDANRIMNKHVKDSLE